MPARNQLPYLIQLLDDESTVVRQEVLKALAAFGDTLQSALANLHEPLNENMQRQILQIVAEYQKQKNLNGISQIGEVESKTKNTFKKGDLVRHKRYGYRGVIVDFDDSCQADDRWYHSNSTQPSKDQPWYFVLVHNSNNVTYAARSSLDFDDTEKEVKHPLIPHFFINFIGNKYIRNNRPWTDETRY